ncbi:MAG TPA: DUF177 domain-containing protein [Alphaproteobacteria bacterium]|nr:DUF177 domain-containing protein [Alphaproteobacteria bacterium]
MALKQPEPEFSRLFAVDRLGQSAITETLLAGPAECAALANRLGLVELSQLSAAVTLERTLGGLIHVSGRLEADVVQTCVVTLVDFPSHVEDSFALDFGNAPAEFGDEIDLDPDYDPPEPIEGGVIDLGELVAQYLALTLDPHPRAPGATLDTELSGADIAETSPFAVLKNLKTTN